MVTILINFIYFSCLFLAAKLINIPKTLNIYNYFSNPTKQCQKISNKKDQKSNPNPPAKERKIQQLKPMTCSSFKKSTIKSKVVFVVWLKLISLLLILGTTKIPKLSMSFQNIWTIRNIFWMDFIHKLVPTNFLEMNHSSNEGANQLFEST